MRLRSSLRPTTAVLALAGALTLGTGVGAAVVGLPGSGKSVVQAAGELDSGLAEPTADAATAATQSAPPSPSAEAVEATTRKRPAPPAPVRASASAAPPVAPLSTLRATDLVVTVRGSVTPAQLSALQATRGVEAAVLVDAGTVKVGGKGARVLGVDPSTFRAFTPQETASSDALWQSVARGELAPDFGLQRSRALGLGSTIAVTGTKEVSRRIGAVAAYGLPDVDLVADRRTARELGVVADSAVLLSAPDRSVSALKKAIRRALGADAQVQVLRAQVVAPRAGRPATYRDLYIDSARYCPGLSWTVLAAIGQVESGHGRHLGPSSAGALGPMQFLPSTWAAYGVDGDGDGEADIMSPYDAVPSAASYLCRFGANRGPEGLYDAIFAYNHADWYVKKVLGIAAQYK